MNKYDHENLRVLFTKYTTYFGKFDRNKNYTSGSIAKEISASVDKLSGHFDTPTSLRGIALQLHAAMNGSEFKSRDLSNGQATVHRARFAAYSSGFMTMTDVLWLENK